MIGHRAGLRGSQLSPTGRIAIRLFAPSLPLPFELFENARRQCYLLGGRILPLLNLEWISRFTYRFALLVG